MLNVKFILSPVGQVAHVASVSPITLIAPSDLVSPVSPVAPVDPIAPLHPGILIVTTEQLWAFILMFYDPVYIYVHFDSIFFNSI